MPQPLSRVHPNPGLEIYAEAAERHPDRAVQVASIFAWWSAVEVQLGRIYAALMGGSNMQQTLAVYHGFNSTEAKVGAVANIVQRTLETKESDMFGAIRRAIIRPAQDARNKLAHWAWAESPQTPDAICLINPTDLIDYYAQAHLRMPHGPFSKIDPSCVFVYRKKDLEDVEAIVKLAHQCAFRFAGLVYSTDGDGRALQYRQLYIVPQIREALDRLEQNRQKKP